MTSQHCTKGPSTQGSFAEHQTESIDRSIFKAYDIRGIVDQSLTEGAVEAIGEALGASALRLAVNRLVIGRDGRLSGPRLLDALARGITRHGVGVIDIGQVTTPMVYFATYALGTGSGVSVTGSHNPPDYNGLKIMMAGETLYGESIQALYLHIQESTQLTKPQTKPEPEPRALDTGSASDLGATDPLRQTHDIWPAYRDRIVADIELSRPMSIAVDCGNGIAGAYAPELFRAIGCKVHTLFCDVDGEFPNHHPDPADPNNLKDLMGCLKNTDAEIGLAFDGDGDRLGVVTKSGKIIWPDRQLMLFAKDILERNPGSQIIFDVKCSRHVARVVREAGGEPLMWQTGHSLIKAKLRETGAPFAGEMSGHFFFKERWYGFDDGLYAAARLLEVLSRFDDPSALLEALPDSPSTPELKLACAQGQHVQLVEQIKKQGLSAFPSAQSLLTIDGVRVEYEDGFGLARSSNTTPVVVMRFEADDQRALNRIQEEFRRAFLAANPGVQLPF